MKWTPLMLGRHYRKTLPQVALLDPDYLFWGIEAGVFAEQGLETEAEMVRERATHIRIPHSAGRRLVAEYTRRHLDGRFAGVEVVPEDRPGHRGSSTVVRLPVFDLGLPRRFCPYDKAGGKALLAALKSYVFGDATCRMTKRRCEAFFEDESNFVLSAPRRPASAEQSHTPPPDPEPADPGPEDTTPEPEPEIILWVEGVPWPTVLI